MKNKKFNKEEFFFTVLFIIVALILLGISLYKIIKNRDLEAANLETTILFAISLVYIVIKLVKDKNFIPTNLKGQKLPIKEDKKDKNKRYKSYLIESLVFSIIVVCLDILSILFFKDKNSLFGLNADKTLNIIFNSMITFGICMLVSFGFECLVGELSIKKINRKKEKK